MKKYCLYSMLLLGLGSALGLMSCRKCTMVYCICYDQPTFKVSLDTLARKWTNEQALKVEIIWQDTRTNQTVGNSPAFGNLIQTSNRTFLVLHPFFYQSPNEGSSRPRMEHSRFIIRQLEMELADTLDGITYQSVMETRKCNSCYPGPDDYYDCARPTRATLRLNGQRLQLRSETEFALTVFGK